MARYERYRYIYPPRPKNAVPPTDLEFWDSGSLLAQPKFNGSNCVVFTNGVDSMIMNRHNQRLTNFQLTPDEIKDIYRGDGDWMVINGEYMNKNKKDETNKAFNHKLVIFDILTFSGEYLVGQTFSQRVELLDDIYGKVECEKDYVYKISENVYRVKSYDNGFLDLFNTLTPIDMIEGLVMKRKNAKLEIGVNELNNVKSQIKCRKVTKLYRF